MGNFAGYYLDTEYKLQRCSTKYLVTALHPNDQSMFKEAIEENGDDEIIQEKVVNNTVNPKYSLIK